MLKSISSWCRDKTESGLSWCLCSDGQRHTVNIQTGRRLGKGQSLLGGSGMVCPRQSFSFVGLVSDAPVLYRLFWFIMPLTVMHKILQISSCILNNLAVFPSWSRGLTVPMKAQEARYKYRVICNRCPSCPGAKEKARM